MMKRMILTVAVMLSVWNSWGQSLHTHNAMLDSAFRLAVWTLDHNTHDGIVAAGAGYGGEWTRDASINCLNAVSLLCPEAAERTLWSVTEAGQRIGHQYWDKIIWTLAAQHHFEVTGDTSFLRRAYRCAARTMQELEAQCFDSAYGLFLGPAVFQDGIEAYPEPIYDHRKWDDSFVLRHPHSDSIRCLSTNVVYLLAYRSLGQMAHKLRLPAEQRRCQSKSAALAGSILRHLYDAPHHRLYYLIDHQGTCHHYQEGLGVSLALGAGLLNREEAGLVLANLKLTHYGIPSVSPSFPRNSRSRPGRHNMMIWPHINAFYADACAKIGAEDEFYRELENMAALAMVNGAGNFYEIYTIDGVPSGGWQCRALWDKKEHQTWCATGYLRLWIDHVFGLHFDDSGRRLQLRPMGMRDGSECRLDGIRWQNTELTIIVRGHGERRLVRINGLPADQPEIEPTGRPTTIEIDLSE